MVGRDMVTRLRPVVGVLAAVALLALGGLDSATTDDVPAIGDRHESVAVAKASRAPAAVAARAARAPVVPLVALAGLLALVATSATGSHTLIGRQRRRPGDDGDDWRSLLLGAPPVLA
jgi:hypothetical protein